MEAKAIANKAMHIASEMCVCECAVFMIISTLMLMPTSSCTYTSTQHSHALQAPQAQGAGGEAQP